MKQTSCKLQRNLRLYGMISSKVINKACHFNKTKTRNHQILLWMKAKINALLGMLRIHTNITFLKACIIRSQKMQYFRKKGKWKHVNLMLPSTITLWPMKTIQQWRISRDLKLLYFLQFKLKLSTMRGWK